MRSGAISRALYFAYGSNLSPWHLRNRVPSARSFCIARLENHRVSFGKLGRDGSGKATLVAETDAHVWGAVYTMDPAHWELLDRFEPGYDRIEIDVTTDLERGLTVTTYLAPETAAVPAANPEYKHLVIAGAREHSLPSAYIDSLIRLPERSDPFK